MEKQNWPNRIKSYLAFAGMLLVGLLSYWQAPAPAGFLFAAVIVAVLDMSICGYLYWRKWDARWVFGTFFVFPMMLFGPLLSKFQPSYNHWSQDVLYTALYMAQWIVVFYATVIIIFICLELFLNLRRRYHGTSLNSS